MGRTGQRGRAGARLARSVALGLTLALARPPPPPHGDAAAPRPSAPRCRRRRRRRGVQGPAARRPPPGSRPRGLPLPAAAFPNDPGFAGCESQDPVSGCTDDEQWDLYGRLTGDTCLDPGGTVADRPHPDGGLPCWARNATDPQHAAGLNFTGAWQQGNVGRGDVRIAYIEGGVNYRVPSIKDGLNSIWLNRRELPYPQRADGSSAGRYDADGNGRLDLRDYARDPRVNPACASGVAPFVTEAEGTTHGCVAGGEHPYINAVPVAGTTTPYLSPEDLIVVFGHCRIVRGAVRSCPAAGRFDNDGNGYPNDVSGWNFERNTNDPQTENVGYSHASGLVSLLGGQPNNAYQGVGACRTCRVVPIKQGAEAVGRTDRWAEAILYAADLGVTAISSVVVEYNYSSFSQAAVDYAYRRGVLLALDSNDFDSMDHSDGMLFDHAIPGNSLALDKPGAAARTFRARSNVTSFGTHNLFSGGEVTTSGATPFMAATLAMVQSAALTARDRHAIPSRLTPDEVKQVLMDTASPVIPQTQTPTVPNQWPGNPRSATDATHTNWSTQYGYGRPDVGAATRLVLAGRVPPTAELTSPRWFGYVDPVRQRNLVVTGRLAASRWRSRGVRWTLEAAPGADPADADFRTVSAGRGGRQGNLGVVDLRRFRRLSRQAPGDTLPPDGPERYTVTLRLRVTDGNGLKAEDRRTFGARHDPALLRGYPRRVGGEIAAGPAYVDLEGRRQNDLVLATYDGVVHALRPDGSEVPGFPVGSDALRAIDPRSPQNSRARAYRDPELRDVRDPLTGVAVGDLFGDGRLEVVATSANAVVYAWDARGRRLRGFPRTSDRRFWSLPVPTPDAPTRHGRLPARGNWSPPVLADLEGTGRLDVLETAYDGQVYAWRPNGQPVPGWPVKIELPDGVLARDGIAPADYIRDAKLMYSVGVADVLGAGKPQVFVSSSECGDDRTAWLYGVWADGNRHAGGPFLPHWPVALPSLSMCYDQSIDFVSEGPTAPVFGKVDASGRTRVISAAPTGPTNVIDGDGSVVRQLSSACPGAGLRGESALPARGPADGHAHRPAGALRPHGRGTPAGRPEPGRRDLDLRRAGHQGPGGAAAGVHEGLGRRRRVAGRRLPGPPGRLPVLHRAGQRGPRRRRGEAGRGRVERLLLDPRLPARRRRGAGLPEVHRPVAELQRRGRRPAHERAPRLRHRQPRGRPVRLAHGGQRRPQRPVVALPPRRAQHRRPGPRHPSPGGGVGAPRARRRAVVAGAGRRRVDRPRRALRGAHLAVADHRRRGVAPGAGRRGRAGAGVGRARDSRCASGCPAAGAGGRRSSRSTAPGTAAPWDAACGWAEAPADRRAIARSTAIPAPRARGVAESII